MSRRQILLGIGLALVTLVAWAAVAALTGGPMTDESLAAVALPTRPVDPNTQRAIDHIRLAEVYGTPSTLQPLRDLLERADTDEPGASASAEVDAALTTLGDLLDALPSLDSGRVVTFPWSPELDGEEPQFVQLIVLGRAAALRASRRLEAGEIRQGTDDLVGGLALGVVLERALGGLLPTMVGLAISERALRRVQLVAHRLDTPALTRLRDLLVQHVADGPHVPSALTYEAYREEHLFDGMRHKTVDELFALSGEVGAPGGGPGFFAYDADETIAGSRYFWDQLLDAAAKPPAERVWPDVSEPDLSPVHLLYNGVGRVLLNIGRPNFLAYVEREDRLRTLRRLVLVRVAIALHQQAKGAPPATIQGLVPDQLAVLPKDLFAHQAVTPRADGHFLYEPSERRLSSGATARDDEEDIALTLTW
jgi:hypothetical protein